ncbi:MAG: glutamine amidotransferase [Pseudomonadota bacterium]
MKPILILQLRPEADAADGEFASFLARGALSADQVHRIRLDQETLPDGLGLDDYSAVIVGGGPGCVSDPVDQKSALDARIENQVMSLMPDIVARDFPFMGCCYGIGILAHHLGAEVSKRAYGEPVGPSTCRQVAEDPLLDGLPDVFEAYVGHKEAVQNLPAGCVHLVESGPCPFQMIRYGQNVYATQFHPEADAGDFEARIRIYQNHGYFPPKDADRLIQACHGADVTVPGEMLRRFVARYQCA